MLIIGRLATELLHTGFVRAFDRLEVLQGGVHDGTDAVMTVIVFFTAEGDDGELAHGLLADGAGGL